MAERALALRVRKAWKKTEKMDIEKEWKGKEQCVVPALSRHLIHIN